MSSELRCVVCGKTYPFSIWRATCPDHDPKYGTLQVVGDAPLFSGITVDLGQMTTPLVRAPRFGTANRVPDLYVKDESRNPTGSFKDRENFILFNHLKEKGINSPIYVVSSGNAAVSTAAYANKAGMPCTCYVPKRTSPGKKRMIRLFGAEIVEIEGSYEEIYERIISDPPEGINATPSICPIKEEGLKRIAHELVDQLGVPDYIVVPCGNGTNLWSIHKGFSELKGEGKIGSVPKMVGVQIKGADPIAQAIAQGKGCVVLDDAPDSVAEGIVATASYASQKAVRAIMESGGHMVSVSDDEVLVAHKEIIARESLLPEVTSSAVFAAVKRLGCPPDAKVVCIMTGSGFKEINGVLPH
ncbi:pyridoxal-phosphate dependent enzyme [Candidatus Woesearchaeota archaeon]|nr:pyridoxal-phosphate dependent enzyme [Candidatus Woesearchaeota archaeon]